jgi:hypothetical protein
MAMTLYTLSVVQVHDPWRAFVILISSRRKAWTLILAADSRREEPAVLTPYPLSRRYSEDIYQESKWVQTPETNIEVDYS